MARQKVRSDSLAAIKLAEDQKKQTIVNHFMAVAEVSYNNFDAAILKFNEALKSKPDFAEALKGRADCYNKMKLYDKERADSLALSKINASVLADPTNKEYLRFTEEFKKTEKLVKDINADLHFTCYYKDDNGWFLRAKTTTFQSDQLSCFAKAIELNPKAEYYVARGNLRNEMKYVDQAKTDFEKAIEINPKYEWYEHEIKHYFTCGDCNGSGYKITYRVAVQEVNGKTNSNSGTEKTKCAYCLNGGVVKAVKVRSVKLQG